MPSSDPRRGELDPESQQIRDSFAYFGLAVFRAQCLERQLVILLATSLNPEFLRTVPEERDIYFDKHSQKTLGQLISSLRQAITLPSSLEGRLCRALILRNWLAHDFFEERSIEALSWEGRERMIDELREAGEFLKSVDEELTGVTEAWLVAHGTTRESIQNELDALISGHVEAD